MITAFIFVFKCGFEVCFRDVRDDRQRSCRAYIALYPGTVSRSLSENKGGVQLATVLVSSNTDISNVSGGASERGF